MLTKDTKFVVELKQHELDWREKLYRKAYIVTICTSSASRTGLLFASAFVIVISNLGKRMTPPEEN